MNKSSKRWSSRKDNLEVRQFVENVFERVAVRVLKAGLDVEIFYANQG